MNELIPIIDNGTAKAVDARTFHEFLCVSTRFNDWIKSRIEKYDFVENEDYEKVTEKIVTSGGEQEATQYIISIDMAKEIAMVEKNDKGKQARKYFIEVEKKAVELHSALSVPKTFREALLLAAEQQLLIEQQAEEIANKQKEIEYKSEVIAGVTDKVSFATMRTIFNRVVKMGQTSGDCIKDRYNNIYKMFKEIHHIDLKARMEGANMRAVKKEYLSVVEYAEKNGYLRDLYNICAKYYETDVKQVMDELLNGAKRRKD